jgi:hypothetical protein
MAALPTTQLGAERDQRAGGEAGERSRKLSRKRAEWAEPDPRVRSGT